MAEALELLAPARDVETARVAVDCGADAVYMGGPGFGARAAATNSVGDIAAAADYAHRFGARLYVTMNTVLLDSELDAARAQAVAMAGAGADALIVQDMAYMMMDLPISLHASTQCDIRTPGKAAFLAGVGFRQLVLPREFTVEQVRQAAMASGGPVEVFIHGARCVSFSGDCQMGFVATGRSGNRGECPQMCRLPYVLEDASGKVISTARHFLSLADLSTSPGRLRELADAGARSFKIEGRLKDRRYVANVTAWYNAMLDRLVADNPDRWRRASFGTSVPGFTPDPYQTFFRRPNGGGREATLDSPKDVGVPLGKVTAPYNARSNSFRIKTGEVLVNGDGLGYFDSEGVFRGFRLNRGTAAGECFPANMPGTLPRATEIYRNSNKAFNDSVDRARPERTMALDVELRFSAGSVTVNARDEADRVVTFTAEVATSVPRNPQFEARKNIFGRLGGSVYRLRNYSEEGGDVFMPASAVTAFKKRIIDGLARCEIPRGDSVQTMKPASLKPYCDTPLDYHDNVTNRLAEKFYIDRGFKIEARGLEAADAIPNDLRVMTTRYCIRRELGACLRSAAADKLPDPLFLNDGTRRYRLGFDCGQCRMTVNRVNIDR